MATPPLLRFTLFAQRHYLPWLSGSSSFMTMKSRRQLHALLKEKVAQGVGIYVLYDRISGAAFPAPTVTYRYATPGCRSRRSPVAAGPPSSVNFRNHRKIVVWMASLALLVGHNVGDAIPGQKNRRWLRRRYPCASHRPGGGLPVWRRPLKTGSGPHGNCRP